MQLVVRAARRSTRRRSRRRCAASVTAVDASVPVGDVRLMDGVVAASAARPRFTALAARAFAVVALALGAVGIYGVLAAGVVRRRREIGVRIALGATRGEVQRLVLREGVGVAASASRSGLAGALAAGRLLRGLLFGVAPADPLVLLAVPALLAVVALAASLLPARRAARARPAAHAPFGLTTRAGCAFCTPPSSRRYERRRTIDGGDMADDRRDESASGAMQRGEAAGTAGAPLPRTDAADTGVDDGGLDAARERSRAREADARRAERGIDDAPRVPVDPNEGNHGIAGGRAGGSGP